MPNKIIITGGNGYIGSHTAVELLNAGYEVVIIDNNCNSKPYILDRIQQISQKKVSFYFADIMNKETWDLVLSEHPDTKGIIHFAAHLFVEESVSKPLKYYHNNLLGLISLLNAIENKDIQLVFSSSCTVYGNPDSLPITEYESVKPAESPYGNTKKIGEEILRDFSKNVSNRIIALRYFNPIGAHPSGLIGEDPLHEHVHLVPVISETALGIRKEMKVFGDDYDTLDGTCVRDYIHVVDLAKAHLKALERLLDAKGETNFEVFNAGTGQGYTVLQIIKTFEEVTGLKVNYKIVDRRPGDAEKIYADTQLIEKTLGWKASLSLSEMLDSAYKWEQSRDAK